MYVVDAYDAAAAVRQGHRLIVAASLSCSSPWLVVSGWHAPLAAPPPPPVRQGRAVVIMLSPLSRRSLACRCRNRRRCVVSARRRRRHRGGAPPPRSRLRACADVAFGQATTSCCVRRHPTLHAYAIAATAGPCRRHAAPNLPTAAATPFVGRTNARTNYEP